MRLSPRVRRELNEIIGFFCERTDGSPIALLRILYGALAVWTSLFLLPNYERYYTESGRLPWDKVKHFPEHIYSILQFAPQSSAFVYAVVWTAIIASFCLLLGVMSRLAAFVLFAIQVALQHRNPFILNSGDHLYLIIAFLLSLTPSDRKWSLRSYFAHRRGKGESSPIFAWSTRLIGLQICYVYLYAFAAKINSKPWINGTAMYDVFASPSLARWPAELDYPVLLALITWGTLVFELFFPLFVWQKEYRRYAIPAGILFHLGIEVTMVLPMFSALMMISYASFLDDEEARAILSFPRRFIDRLRGTTSPSPAEVEAHVSPSD